MLHTAALANSRRDQVPDLEDLSDKLGITQVRTPKADQGNKHRHSHTPQRTHACTCAIDGLFFG